MGFVEPGNVVDDTHPPHLGPDRFENPWGEIVLLTKRAKRRDKLVFGVFQLDEDGQEDLLLISTPWMEQSGQLV
jgi:hypothetical protein